MGNSQTPFSGKYQDKIHSTPFSIIHNQQLKNNLWFGTS
jgi:hypothetical protein